MILSDRHIKEAVKKRLIEIDPFDDMLVGSASVDVRLDKKFLVFQHADHPFIDVKKPNPDLTKEVIVQGEKPFILHPGEFVLGSTMERVKLPSDIVARIEGKSSLGRLGLLIHSTAGFVHPGWNGKLTLELSNVSRLPMTLYPGMPIGQLFFMTMSEASEHPYGTAPLDYYQGQDGASASKYHQTFELLKKR